MRRESMLLSAILLFTIIVMATRLPPIGNDPFDASAVQASGNVGVYWDSNCTKPVSSLSWGTLAPGQIDRVVVYVRNEGNESVVLVETAVNWTPSNASTYLTFSWYYAERKIDPWKVSKVTQLLYVSRYTNGITDFSFGIVFEARKYFLGDVNRDGAVNMFDLVVVAIAYGATPVSPNWNSYADLNQDGIVNILDVAVVAMNYGEG